MRLTTGSARSKLHVSTPDTILFISEQFGDLGSFCPLANYRARREGAGLRSGGSNLVTHEIAPSRIVWVMAPAQAERIMCSRVSRISCVQPRPLLTYTSVSELKLESLAGKYWRNGRGIRSFVSGGACWRIQNLTIW